MKKKSKIFNGLVIMACALFLLVISYLLTDSGLVSSKTDNETIFDIIVKEFIEETSMMTMKKNMGVFQYMERGGSINLLGIINNPMLPYLFKEIVYDGYSFVDYGKIQEENDVSRIKNSKELFEKNNGGDEDTDVEIVSSGDMEIFSEQSSDENLNLVAETNKIAQIRKENLKKIQTLKSTWDSEYLINQFYIVDSTTTAPKSLFPVKKLLKKDFSFQKKDKPQILIFHTHGASESFADSRKGEKEDSVIGVGTYLSKILRDEYGYQVIHDETEYDRIDGKIDRNKAYNMALASVQKTLEKNPSIEVIIDLHRDGGDNQGRRVTVINGKSTAQIMLFNGLSRNRSGPIAYLNNPNLEGNLAFSLQMKIKAMELYPNFTIKNYLKGYRYNMHLRERFLLVELGNQNNTLEEAKNAMDAMAEVLHKVITK